MKYNRVEIVNLSGGLIGLLGTNPAKAVNARIQLLAADGWHCHQIITHSTRNIFILFLQLLILVCTIGLWTFGAGYMLLMVKEAPESNIVEQQTRNQGTRLGTGIPE